MAALETEVSSRSSQGPGSLPQGDLGDGLGHPFLLKIGMVSSDLFRYIYIYRLLRIIGMVSILLLMIQIYFYSTPVPGKVADGLLVFRLG